MKRPLILRSMLMALLPMLAAAQPAEVRWKVSNPSDIPRPQEPVVMAWADVAKALPSLSTPSVIILDDAGRSLMTQVDDLDADGTPDELVFVADFAPHQERTFIMRAGPKPTGLPSPPVRTDAGNWKKRPSGNVAVDDDDGPGYLRDQGSYRYDGVGWESELTGYRLYLDERNALDIQGKRRPGLYWNFIGSTSVDYQADGDWGMDVLHVGPALGVGGFGFWISDSVVKPYVLDRRRTRILARGPVRAVVRVEYRGWEVGSERLDATSVYTIYAGETCTEHRLTVAGAEARTVATGIVKHAEGKVTWDAAAGVLRSAGKQSRSGEWLRMSLYVRPGDVQRVTADAWNDLLILSSAEGRPMRYIVSNTWGNTSVDEDRMEREQAARIGARLLSPLTIAEILQK